MLLIIKFLAKLLSVLNSEVSPAQIAAGFAFGALIGLVPFNGLLPVFLLLIAFLININLPMVFLGMAVFKILSFGIDPLANQIGFHLLTQIPDLKPFWTKLYNMSLIPYIRFNNTIVLGSFVIGVCALIPLFILMRLLVKSYRESWKEKFLKLKIVQIISASRLYKYYLTYKGITGQ